MSEIWIHVADFGASDLSRTIGLSLDKLGYTIRPQDACDKGDAGIVCFSEVSQPLIEFVREKASYNQRVIAVVDSRFHSKNSDTWTLLQAGASEVLSVKRSVEAVTKQIAERIERWGEVDRLLTSQMVRNNFVTESHSCKLVLRQIIEIAYFTNASVLVLGESGTGKELIARLIHTLDKRSKVPDLVVLDCSTIVSELAGSEFFGHERGAFTGAIGPREGAFSLAHQGTLFLDEVGELPLPLQAQLLRVVQEKTYKRVGGDKWQRSDFRLVCATNRDLTQEVNQGRFRGDLYYRIATWTCRLPPLRERPEDILPLANHFIKEFCPSVKPIEFDEPVQEYLVNRIFPGNVRELRQLMLRISQKHVGDGPITVGDIPEDERSSGFTETNWRDSEFDQVIRRALALGAGLKEISQYASDTAIRIAVGDADGNLQRAARCLGITDRALQMRRANSRVR